jgi:arylsulfatase
MRSNITGWFVLTLVIAASLQAAAAADGADPAAASASKTAGPFRNGDALNALDSPQVANHALLVSAEIEPKGLNGVILAQGAGSNGYALYLKDGKPAFAVRSQGALTTVIANEPLGPGVFKVEAKLGPDGGISILVDGKPVATGRAAGLIAAQPARGLTVGLNYKSVGDYTPPNSFAGKIERATVQIW